MIQLSIVVALKYSYAQVYIDVTEIMIKKGRKTRVKTCRDGMPKTMQMWLG